MPEHSLLRKPLPPKLSPPKSVFTAKESKGLHPGYEQRIIRNCAPESLPEIQFGLYSGYEGRILRSYVLASSPESQYCYPKTHKCSLQDIRNKLPVQIIRNFVVPFTPSGPDSLPLRKPRICRPRVHLLEVVHDDPRYITKPEFSLDDFLAKPELYSWPAKEQLEKAVISRHNYKKLVELFTTELQKRTQTKINTLLLSSDDIPEASSRVPYRQVILEMAALIRQHAKRVTFKEYVAEDEGADNLEESDAALTTDRGRITDKESSFAECAGAEAILNSFSSKYFQGALRSGSPFKYGEGNEMISPSELAVLDCLVQGGTVLSLKAHFIPQVPDLTPLRHTLCYLNLSFNYLQQIPNELFYIQNLEVLKLRNNPIKKIPAGIEKLGKLRTFVISFCLLSALPTGLFCLPCLQFLDVSYNSISSIPNDIQKLRALEFLNVEGNELPALPCGALQLPLKQLRVQNNYMHPLFWKFNSQNQPQRLTDLAAVTFSKSNLSHTYSKIPEAVQEILSSTMSGSCDCCKGPLYGGLKLIRHCGKAFGIRHLPFIFYVCSPSCYDVFMSKSNIISEDYD
ncbi:leucine-rich repeat-containing protein 63 [Protopterus annectens]|uniref:leucine-rich repeat-containing protein 63 n=1 Tax=Protopterus annectens TaxID=7888 RepID=UPI001CFC31EC|nr:leucine-rich repeat-containing protein 63 [Protopterus annectens]XP_043927516.1 leucine-rich repeat-containing protein 63 [Protopterus annectens]